MACDSQIIASYDTDSELAKVIGKVDAGVTVEPENAVALAEAIVNAKEETTTVHSRDYIMSIADKTCCAQKYVNVLKGVII